MTDEELIKEVDVGYYIPCGQGMYHFQRKEPEIATEMPLSQYENTLIYLCKTLLNVQKLNAELKDKYNDR